MKKKIWYIVWSILFLSGATLSLLYVQGFRYQSESHELIPTGVLDISTNPEGALIFLNGSLRGTTSEIFRGYPLGNIKIAFEKSGFQSIEAEIRVAKDFITRVSNIVLIPIRSSERSTAIDYDHNIIWDPQRRGFVQVLPSHKALQIIDILAQKRVIMELSAPPKKIYITATGDLQIVFSDMPSISQKIFSNRFFTSYESLIAESFLSPATKELLLYRGQALFLKNLDTGTIQQIGSFDQPIQGAWWLPESDEILVVTDAEILLWSYSLQKKRIFQGSDNIGEAIFVPDVQMLFYKSGKIWKSVKFDLK